jgi:hypothetical protein
VLRFAEAVAQTGKAAVGAVRGTAYATDDKNYFRERAATLPPSQAKRERSRDVRGVSELVRTGSATHDFARARIPTCAGPATLRGQLGAV